jgi:cbb3-type cytochrome oxidase subunit 3
VCLFSLLTPTRSLFLMWFVITYHRATHPTNPHHPFPLFFFYIKININKLIKKLRLSLIMSTCYSGALSDPVENIFFLSRGAFNKTRNFTKIIWRILFCLSSVCCILFLYSKRKKSNQSLSKNLLKSTATQNHTYKYVHTHTRIIYIVPQTI